MDDGLTTYRTRRLWINSEIRWITTLLARIVVCCGISVAELRCLAAKMPGISPAGRVYDAA